MAAMTDELFLGDGLWCTLKRRNDHSLRLFTQDHFNDKSTNMNIGYTKVDSALFVYSDDHHARYYSSTSGSGKMGCWRVSMSLSATRSG
jgi:hypothetical protein